jgi:hypothetical protein
MPPKRYGQRQAPCVVVGLNKKRDMKGDFDMDSQEASDSGLESQERAASPADADSYQDPFAYDVADSSETTHGQSAAWDFSDSTSVQKTMSPAKKVLHHKEERGGASQSSAMAETKGSVIRSSSFIGEFGQVI